MQQTTKTAKEIFDAMEVFFNLLATHKEELQRLPTTQYITKDKRVLTLTTLPTARQAAILNKFMPALMKANSDYLNLIVRLEANEE